MIKDQTKHTNLPWGVGREFGTVVASAEPDYVLVRCQENKLERIRANAAYIVLACNAYPELVRALKIMIAHASETYPHFESERGKIDIQNAKAALEKAGEL